nr:non-ribosomal peptide synthetase [Chromobacterium phragmitis]
MWLEELRQESAPAHVFPVCLKVLGPLDVAALQTSIDRLVERHESLRVSFIVNSSDPKQQVNETVDVTIRRVVMQHTGLLEHTIVQILLETMSLEGGPLFRVTLLELGPEENVLLFAVHHLVVDHQSIDRLLQDFYAIYHSEVNGERCPLTPLATPYSTHVQAVADAGVSPEAAAYWRHEMTDLPAPLLFASGDVGQAQTGRRSAKTAIRHLDVETTAALRKLGTESGATPFMVHLAICAVLMQRHTGAQDIVFGVPLSTRSDSRLQSLVGLFVNTLPLRLRFSPCSTFEALLRLVRARLLRTMMHVGLPLHELIGMLRLERHTGSNPLFHVCVNYAMSTTPDRISSGGCDFETVALPALKAAFEVNFTLLESTTGSRVCFEFDEDVLSADDAEDILDQYLRVLAQVSEMPRQAVRDIHLHDTPSFSIATTSNNTPFEPVHKRIERQATQSPDVVAIVCAGQQLTYAELNARANRMALLLIEQGAVPGSLIAICTDRRPEMVVAVLAVLRVGGAYIPIDQDNPDERLKFILEDTQAHIFMTSRSLFHRFSHLPVTILCADEDELGELESDDENVDVAVGPDDLAYCVYTSGSTGQPKGALNTHAGFANLLDWYTQDIPMRPVDRVMLASSFGFDMTQKTLLGPLSVGAKLLMPGCTPADHHGFTQALTTHRPSWLSCAPSAFRSFMDSPAIDNIDTLVLGGEPLDDAILTALRGKPVKLVNSYGPSECADIAIWCARLMHLTDADDTAMPLGEPVRNVRIYVLDDQLRPVPAGVPGDLYIAGAGVGRGYLRRPDLTNKHFLPDPFGMPGSRMYKTGDLGRRRRDGVFEYLGRTDDQVKLRGNRIEPGEIENCLRACDSVQDSVVVLREVAPGETHLVAYVVARVAHSIEVDKLRRTLRRMLPEFMVPTAWVTLSALPLNLNGKIDRKALPLPLRITDTVRAITPPRTPTEACLIDIWKTVLGVQQVCVFDNFFDLWGQSLLAVKVAALVAKRLGVPLPIRAIFDAKDIATLASAIDDGDVNQSSAVHMTCWHTAAARPRIYGFPAAGMYSAAYYLLAEALAPSFDLCILEPLESCDDGENPSTIETLAKHYAQAIPMQGGSTPLCLLGHSFGASVAYETARRLEQRGQPINLVLLDTTLVSPLELTNDWGDADADPTTTAATDEVQAQLLATARSLQARHWNMLTRYTPSGPFNGDALLVFAHDDVLKVRFEMAIISICRSWVRGQLRTISTRGNHLSILQAGQVSSLAALIRDYLEPACLESKTMSALR